MTTSTAASSSSEYFFCLCQPGLEKVLRDELMAAGFSPSFSSNGFVSAKSATKLTMATLPRPVLARRVCLHVDKVAIGDDKAVARAAAKVGADVVHREAGDRGADASIEDVVVTVVERGNAVFVGAHVHVAGISPAPFGDPQLEVPSSAPSRAWLKLEEAARIWSLPLEAGDRVVEVGCAPGGVTRALLDRGATVVGVDPNEMDPRILSDARFTHLHAPAQQIEASLLEAPVRMLIVDVNQRPNAAISSVESIIKHTRGDLRAALFTLKLGSWSHFGELAHWRARLEKLLGMTTTATQLPANRQELCVYCCTSKIVSVGNDPSTRATLPLSPPRRA